MASWLKRTLFAGALGLALCACQAGERLAGPDCQGIAAVDEATLRYLSELRARHQEADRHEEAGALPEASQALAAALALPAPGGLPAEEAYLDLAARAAALLNRQGRASEALALIAEALARAPGEGFYLAALKMVEGEAYEARAAARRASGDAAGASGDEARALEAYEASQRINRKILERLLSP